MFLHVIFFCFPTVLPFMRNITLLLFLTQNDGLLFAVAIVQVGASQEGSQWKASSTGLGFQTLVGRF